MAPSEQAKKISTLPNVDYSCASAMQILSASVFPMVLQSAVSLGLLDIITEAGLNTYLSAQQIVTQLRTQNPEAPAMVDRILRLLATHSVVTCTVNNGENGSVQWLYGSTPLSKYFLLDQKEISLAPFLHLFHQKALMDSWYGLKDAVLEGGIPFNKVHGMNAFEYHANDPILNQVFHKAMMSLTTVVMKGVLQNYKGFENLKEVVDVGGGIGITLDMIISKYPGIRGINFDLPHIIQQAQISYPGVKHHKGDMFDSIPRAEAILLKGILHDWSDEHCLKILKNCHAALPDDGKLIVIDLLLPEEPEISDAARYITQIDLSMMAINPGGKERAKHEYETLAGSIGFKDVRFEYGACCYWVMEFYK